MCGIAGLLNFSQVVAPEVIRAMTRALSHRGPDGEGFFIQNNVAIGHRRLAIIDLETGKQPLCNEDETIWITFNGEIYNYQDLRTQLERAGHRFNTKSDTEVIVHAYEEWGERCVQKFRGMFAFGIVDLKQRRLFIARDQVGIKPLYYLLTPDCFAFASELQALRQLPIHLDIDIQAIDSYLWLQYIPAPQTIFQQIKKLRPAHFLSVSFEGQITPPQRYWQLQFIPDLSRKREDWLAELDYILRESVKCHLTSDVPFGAFLSGGVDSSAIVGYMSQLLNQPVKTFSIGFEEAEFNELSYAEIPANTWHTKHHTQIVTPESLETLLPKLVRHYGEPFGDSSVIPTFYVCKMAREQVTMVLSGDGGDECFAGYNTYRAWLAWLNYDEKPQWKRLAYPLARILKPKRYPPRQANAQGWFRFITQVPLDIRAKLWRPEYRKYVGQAIDIFSEADRASQGYTPSHKAQYFDINTYLPGSILTKVDVASMMHGLEVRTPLVDVNVFEFAATIPEKFNINYNDKNELEGKLLLKSLMSYDYSKEFLHRPKMGFSTPIEIWLGSLGNYRQHIKDRLLNKSSKLLQYFEQESLRNILHRKQSHPVWLLLFLDEWLSQNT